MWFARRVFADHNKSDLARLQFFYALRAGDEFAARMENARDAHEIA